ncbi:MAG: WD40 repeat domain-containing protein [Gemmataceae bacterium]
MIVLKGGPARGLTFSPDGRLLQIAYDAWWSLPDGVRRPEVPMVHSPVFLDARTAVGILGRDSVAQIDLGTGEVVRTGTVRRSLSQVNWLLLPPDRTRLIGINWLSRADAAPVWWSLPELERVEGWPAGVTLPEAVRVLATPQGGLFLLGRDRGLLRVDAATGATVWEVKVTADRWASTLAGSPDGRTLALASRTWVRLFDAADGTQVGELRQSPRHFLGAAFTPDGRFLATVSHEKTVKFFDTSSWQMRHELAWNVGGLRVIAFSPDGMLAAAGGWGKKVVVWDLDL